jgi:hypothetical protein
MVEPDMPQMAIWCMNIAYWITKATDTQSQYVILIAFSASHKSNPSSVPQGYVDSSR